jgi:hypothetical protein
MSKGGVTEAKSLDYSPPQGPKGQMHESVGLGGDNCGPCGTQGPKSPAPETSGGPGLGGTNHGCCGSQGKH